MSRFRSEDTASEVLEIGLSKDSTCCARSLSFCSTASVSLSLGIRSSASIDLHAFRASERAWLISACVAGGETGLFRGLEMASGAVFDMGIACALNDKVS